MALLQKRAKPEERERRDLRPLLMVAVFAALFLGMLAVGVHVVRVNYFGDGESQRLAAQRSNIEKGVNSAFSTSSEGSASEADAQNQNQHKQDSEKQQSGDTAPGSRNAAGEEEEQDANQFSISGAVMDDTGGLLPGATVTAQPVNGPRYDTNGAQPAGIQLTQQTNNLGSFEFTDLADGEYELTASKGEDYFPASQRVRTGLENAEIVLQRLRIVQVFGQVTDEDGAPLGDVKIRTLGTQNNVQSDENGGYEILTAPVKAGSAPVLDFSLSGFQEKRQRVEAALDPETTEVQLDVLLKYEGEEPEVALSGQVLGPLGEAAEGVRIRLGSFRSQKSYSANSDKSGMFDFPGVEVGDGYSLRVLPSDNYEGYESEVFAMGPMDDFREIVLEAADYSDLSGTITDLAGRPLGGFTLRLRGVGNNAQPAVLLETDGSGHFQLEKLRAGEIRLESRSAPMLRATNIILKPGQEAQIDIPLDWGNDWLLGQVVNPQGQPVSGASVVVTWEENFRNLVSESRRDVRSDLEGYFSVSNLGADVYTLTIQAPGHRTTRIQHQLGQDMQEIQVLLPTNGTAGGTGNGGS